jgi:L-xylulokinase
MGVAMCAGVATGQYPSLLDASKAFSKISYVCVPDALKKDIYDKKYAMYQKAIYCLEPVWNSWNE